MVCKMHLWNYDKRCQIECLSLINNYYLSNEDSLEPFCVKISHQVGHGYWHLTGPSIKVSSAFHLRSYNPAKSLSWWSDCSHSNNYTVCVRVMSTKESLEEDKGIFYSHRPECQSCSLCGRQTAWRRDWSLADQWPQWQMCCLIPELAAAPAGVNINWLTVSRRVRAPPMWQQSTSHASPSL